MTNQTHQEEIALLVGVFLLISIFLEIFFFSSNDLLKLISLGGSSTAIALLILYIFIVQPMRGGSRGSSIYSKYRSGSFQPTVIPPSRIVKKSIMKGLCQQCGKSALLGFTCSYCNGYFCPEHRLPEKHECLGI